MKTKKSLIALVLSTLTLAPSGTLLWAQQGGNSSGGGTGVLKESKFVFMDLRNSIEALNQSKSTKQIRVASSLKVARLERLLPQALPGFSVLEERISKNIQTQNILATIRSMPCLATNAKLDELNDAMFAKDEERLPTFTVARFVPKELITFEHEESKSGLVYVNEILLSELSPLNQAGLLVHESLRWVTDGKMPTEQVQLLTEKILNNNLNQEEAELIVRYFPVHNFGLLDVERTVRLAKSVGFTDTEIQNFLDVLARNGFQNDNRSRLDVLIELKDIREKARAVQYEYLFDGNKVKGQELEVEIRALNYAHDVLLGRAMESWVEESRTLSISTKFLTTQYRLMARGECIMVLIPELVEK